MTIISQVCKSWALQLYKLRIKELREKRVGKEIKKRDNYLAQ